ncbi:hypothetical protein PRIPAC_79731 [Pristionchus pacificus]|uniref:Uncharacterized protein n=1 Tax=Pristionchus pacificus TaxID=54126 RepID=A0A2A6C2E9_PRIPA|nr:hypothetical protein PRIPAC_79731 [Pristionchus pacificus]|eukprot:PDM72345.1 hypothetical protein PRIPAC_38779 [Pristionchus pacificus]
MRFLPFFILIFLLPISLAAPKGPYIRRCFSTSVKPIIMNHVDSTASLWRASPRNYEEAMNKNTPKTINRSNETKNEKPNSWIPDRQVIVELIECDSQHSFCCIVENYDRFNYRIYKCGGNSECGSHADGTFPARDHHHPYSTLKKDNETTMLCSSAWNTPCQFRGYPH